MRRICLFFALLTALLCGLAITAQAAGPAGSIPVRVYSEAEGVYQDTVEADLVSLTLNGNPLTPDGVPALIQYVDGDGRTLVPVRLVSEALDAEVLWVAETRQVIILKGEDTIVLTLGSAQASINGVLTDLPGQVPAGAVKYNGLESTMVPLRFVSEALDAQIEWDNDTFTAAIQVRDVSPFPEPTPSPSVSPTPEPSPSLSPTPEPTASPEPTPSPSPEPPAEGDLGRIVSIESDDNAQSLFLATDHVPQVAIADLGDRVAVDLLGATIEPASGAVLVENEVITSVRFALHEDDAVSAGYPHAVRFVIDLKEGSTYTKNITVETETGGVRITSYNTAVPEEPSEPLPTIDPSKKTVVIDPGHGGSASGACYEDILEKDITLPMSLKLRDILEEMGYNVVMTRDEDVYMTLTERCQVANSIGADIFVSIHCNALENNTSYQGLFTFYSTGSTLGQRLAQFVQTAAAGSTGTIDRGIQNNSDYTVLIQTDMPAILVETGFISSHEELMNLCDEDYQALMAQGIAEGIDLYFRSTAAER